MKYNGNLEKDIKNIFLKHRKTQPFDPSANYKNDLWVSAINLHQELNLLSIEHILCFAKLISNGVIDETGRINYSPNHEHYYIWNTDEN